jgi:hypothetical protein
MELPRFEIEALCNSLFIQGGIMLRSRKLVVHLLLALMLFAAVSSASAASRPTATSTTVRETVEWTLPAGQCPSLPTGVSVSGTGARLAVTNTNVNADGSSRIVSNDLVKGTAGGSDGSTYSFVYHNHTMQTVPSGAGLPIQVSMVDDFVLSGNGGAVDMRIGFNWRWTSPSAEIWPPADNWQQISTRGDPFLCDPI